MKATRMVTAVLATALAAGWAPAVPSRGDAPTAAGFPTQGSQVLSADAPRDASTGLPTGKRQH